MSTKNITAYEAEQLGNAKLGVPFSSYTQVGSCKAPTLVFRSVACECSLAGCQVLTASQGCDHHAQTIANV